MRRQTSCITELAWGAEQTSRIRPRQISLARRICRLISARRVNNQMNLQTKSNQVEQNEMSRCLSFSVITFVCILQRCDPVDPAVQ